VLVAVDEAALVALSAGNAGLATRALFRKQQKPIAAMRLFRFGHAD